MAPAPLLLLAALAAAAGAGEQQSQSSSYPVQTTYSLPSAVHYAHQQQWLEFKRQHDAEMSRLDSLARQPSPRAAAPAAVYRRPAAEAPEPYRPAGPVYAEVREFKDTFSDAVRAFLADKTKRSRGVFRLKDDLTGEILRLRLEHVHADRLRYPEAGVAAGCVGFVTVDAPKRTVDLDFELAKDWEWEVSKVFVHAVNGRERFAYDADGRRLAAPAEPAASEEVPAPTAPANLTAQIRRTPAGLDVTVANAGPGDAYAVRLRLDVRSAPPGVTLPPETDFGRVPAGRSASRAVSPSLAEGAAGGKVKALASVVEGNGFDTEPMMLEFDAVPPAASSLEPAGVSVQGGSVEAGRAVRLSLSIRNAGSAPARGVKAALRVGAGLFLSDEPSVALGDVPPGDVKEAVFEFFVNKRVRADADLPIWLSAKDSSGRGFSDRPVPLRLGAAAGPARALVLGRDAAEDVAAVDRPPRARTPRDARAFAVVIGVEKYRDVAGVDYAGRDAQAVRDWLVEAMGFAPENVALLKDERAGRADLATYLGPWLADRAAGGDSRVFVYYSGHGTVDPKTGDTYLVPYDGDPSYPETKGFALKELYAALGRLPGADALVALDSCFSGSGGRSVLARGVRPLVPARAAAAPANVVVLSASGGDQASASHPGARHGLMTYHLLRGLGGRADGDRDGRVTTLELFRFVEPAVEADARLQHVEQRPRLEPPPERIGRRGARAWIRL